MRSVSAASSASPQRRTDAFTGCQLHPSSSETSPRGRPRPPWRVVQRPARVVSFSRGGAISGSCSVTVPAPQPRSGQRHRRLCQTSRAGRPNAGRSTNSTSTVRRRTTTARHSRSHVRPRRPAADMHPQRLTSLVLDAEHLDVAQSHQQLTDARRVALPQGSSSDSVACQRRFWGIPRFQPRTLTSLTPTSNAESPQRRPARQSTRCRQSLRLHHFGQPHRSSLRPKHRTRAADARSQARRQHHRPLPRTHRNQAAKSAASGLAAN